MKSITCPECGSPMVLRESAKYRYPDGSPRRFYGCSTFPDCRSAHGAHRDGRPLGIPGDAATKAARMRAHEVFDRLWKSGDMTRKDAYRVLRGLMRMTEAEAHIGRFSADQCEWLISRLAGWQAEVAT